MTFQDPYVYPGTTILRNKYDIRDQEKLSETERRVTWKGRLSLIEKPPSQDYGLAHLQAIHSRLFSEIYDWAGQLRTVNLSKEHTNFLPGAYLKNGINEVATKIRETGLVSRDLSDDEFCIAISNVLSDLNFVHPFREGNGRAQRAFLDDIASASGRILAWRNVSTIDHLNASIQSAKDGNGVAFLPLFREMLKPPKDGHATLESRIYDTTPTTTSSTFPAKPWTGLQSFYGAGVCGAWMPRTKTTCILHAGHGGHHRSKLLKH